jgi:hypothetical protein
VAVLTHIANILTPHIMFEYRKKKNASDWKDLPVRVKIQEDKEKERVRRLLNGFRMAKIVK